MSADSGYTPALNGSGGSAPAVSDADGSAPSISDSVLRAPVNRVIPFSNVDGPGNRTAVFFQGCGFHCRFCHNPETINLCSACGLCVSSCPVQALSFDGDPAEGSAPGGHSVPASLPAASSPHPADFARDDPAKALRRILWDYEKCVQCDTCIRLCPHSASPRVRWMTVDEVFSEIRRTLPYIDGITASGGDCTLYPRFLTRLFSRVSALGKTCLIDGNGAFDFSENPELLRACDGVMLDVKAVDPSWSTYLIGNSGESVLASLDFLLSAGKLAEVRTIILPGRDAENEQTVRYTAERIRSSCPYKIIRYRPFGVREEYQRELGEDTADADYAEKYAALARGLGASLAYVV